MSQRINGSGVEGVTMNVGQSAHAEGFNAKAQGIGAHAEGNSTIASAQYSHAEGTGGQASGFYSHVEGQNTNASGTAAHAEGGACSASGNYSHAEGNTCTANATNAHAEGGSTQASGVSSHAEGSGTTASGQFSRAGGNQSVASADLSQAWGREAKAQRYGQSAQASVSPGNSLQSSVAQFSTYTIGVLVAATTNVSTEVTMDGSVTPILTGTGCNVLVIPLKSLMLVTLNLIARPTNASFGGSMAGCAWSKQFLVGRGNNTGLGAQMMYGSTVYTTGGPSLPADWVSDSNLSSNQLSVSVNQADTTNNFLSVKFFQGASAGYPMAVSGSLQVQELVTNS